jgi:hypothetical protein
VCHAAQLVLLVLEQRVGCLRDEDLSAVPGSADAGSTVDGQAEVAVGGDRGVAGVDAHPHPDLESAGPVLLEQGALGGGRRQDGVLGTREDDEE